MNRRYFLKNSLAAGAGTATFTGMLGQAAAFSGLAPMAKNRIFVLIHLQGGFDGLSAIVPIGDDDYLRARPNCAITPNETLPLNAVWGWHHALAPIKRLYDENKAALALYVGAHARNAGTLAGSWIGAYHDAHATQGPTLLPNAPTCLAVGSSTSSDMNVKNARHIARHADFHKRAGFTHAMNIAAGAGGKRLTFPDTELGNTLAMTARLINGGLKTQFYVISVDSFGAAAAQPWRHAQLLGDLAESVDCFWRSIERAGYGARVAGLIAADGGSSLYERYIRETTIRGAAPLIAFGAHVRGGTIIDDSMKANAVDTQGRLPATFDMQNVYAAVWRDHFGCTQRTMQSASGSRHTPLPLFRQHTVIA